MIQLLFMLLFVEMILIIMFVFKTPLRKLVIMGLDRMKRGRGPIVVKTVGGTIFVVMGSSFYDYKSIRSRWIEDGDLNPTDQVLMANHLLEASLMGFSLFLALMIDRLHHYIRELRLRRKSMEAVKKQSQGFEDSKNVAAKEIKGFEDSKNVAAKEIKGLEEEMNTLTVKIKQLQVDLEMKTKEANNAEEKTLALKKQSEGFLLEYDRLLEENQNLRDQLQSLDRRLSRTNNKKST